MLTNVIRLFGRICLGFFFACILSFTLFSVASAEIGNSKNQIEQKYGDCFLIQDGSSRIWTQDEWNHSPNSDAKAYGYMATSGKMNATIWIEYNKQKQVVKETTILDGSIKIRDLKKYFDELYTAIIAPDSAVFVIKALPQEQLGAVVQKSNKKINLIRFFMDKWDDDTKINMHSKIRGFEITEIASDDVKKFLRKSKSVQLTSDVGGKQATYDGTWVRADNYFQDELYFSDNLVPRKKTDMIVIHHTYIEHMSVADIHEFHLKRGWAGIAYHKVILPNGTVENGRPQNMVGAHALGANPRSIGIVLVGNFENTSPTSVQMDALVKLTLELMRQYHIPLKNIVPHRAVTQGTSCPGTLFPWEEFIQRLKENSDR